MTMQNHSKVAIEYTRVGPVSDLCSGDLVFIAYPVKWFVWPQDKIFSKLLAFEPF